MGMDSLDAIQRFHNAKINLMNLFPISQMRLNITANGFLEYEAQLFAAQTTEYILLHT